MSEENKMPEQDTEKSAPEQSSTIFTDPVVVSEKKPNMTTSKKRLVLILCSVAAALIVAFGIFAINQWGPADPTTVSSDDSLYAVLLSKENVASVAVSYDGNERIFEHKSGEDELWSLQGVNVAYTSSSLIENYMASFTNLAALKEISVDDPAAFGFDEPTLTATITLTDGNPITITLGKEVPALGGWYLSTGESGKAYLIGDSTASLLKKDSLELAETTLFNALKEETNPDYFVSSVLTYFDYYHIDGSNFPQLISIYCDKDDPSDNFYHMSSPHDRLVSAESMEDLLSMFSDGFAASGLYSYTSTDAERAEYGLNQPFATLSAKVGNAIIRMTVGAPIDGYYPVLFGDREPIYKIKTTNVSVSFASAAAEQYVSILTLSDNISSIASFRFLADGLDGTVTLTHDPDDATEWTAKTGATELDVNSVRYLYQHVMLAVPLITVFEADRSSITLKIIVGYTDGSEKTLEFTAYGDSERRYVSWLNGETQGIVTKDKVDNIIEAAKKVLSGGTITSPAS